VLDKRNGRLIARDHEKIAPRIFHATWSAPSLAVVEGHPLVFLAGGNGFVYAFETLFLDTRNNSSAGTSTEVSGLKKVWQFDFDPAAPKENVHRYNTNRREGPSNIYGMPVFHRDRLYVAGGGDVFWGKTEAWLKCIDAKGTGEKTTNGLVWSYPLEKHVMSTPAVHEGLVFIADCGRKFHCLDAGSGQALWTHEIKGEAWASPLVADGKVYLGTRGRMFYVFSAGKAKKVITETELPAPISATATAANGVLYVATMTHLYAIQNGGPTSAAAD